MSADGPSSASQTKNPLRALFARLGGHGEAEERSHSDSEGSVDLVDQAEAFQGVKVEDVMTPRADIVALELGTPLGEVVRAFVDTEHSRMPIYRETLDDPVGVAHIKDVMKLIAPLAERSTPDWNEPALTRLRRDTLYVPASMRAADLLLKMQATRIHMALVIDEFGGTDGLVTLEDLVESVVGEIEDEHDEHVAVAVVQRPGGVIEAEARAPLEQLETVVGQTLALPDFEEEIDTVAGLVSALAGRVPQRGEVIPHPAGWDFEVLDADPRRIKRVRLRKVERALEADQAQPEISK
ncbi:MAG: HlyC/CorC family transporter [Proteobacteria bacterium]|nr:HlyC/CorC family transporter [Pseudomonadota bacterium]